MRHERAALLLSEYLAGSLRPRDHARVEAHLFGCPECRQTLVELRRTTELLRALRDVEAPDLADSVLARIRAGEAEPSVLDRLRTGLSRFLAGPLGAPLATAGIGLALLAVLPRIEVEVSIPGRVASSPAALLAPPPAPRTAQPHPPSSPLLARRVNESLSREPAGLAPSGSYVCFEAASFDACRDHHEFMTRLAMENVRAFLARVQEVPEPRREDWLGELTRFAADAGSASDVAARLRETGDPQAQRLARRFEQAR